ncbi:Actin-binding, cofilin/tropomyosin type [Ascosphaera apis ARSEF 7405]|uniref:Actin-binding, cofilin/tropomyosin type n=1 Tax=Ascosphaera apis ARSEF 7405 TaxID=392613 RepID=A0A166N236_9EURO|nr:Actin-binding, cofilin/tropomyosin type [Ascosphaera apis ARSEF 7405]
MQSGITVSPELRDAFTKFLQTPSSFCLPVTISSEALVPLDAIAFPSDISSSSKNEFYTALPLLGSVIQPKTPLYLILRRTSTPQTNESFIALTYIPSNSGVRSKTLFASTRATLVRDLGSSYFPTTVFAADEEEVLSEHVWRERESDVLSASGSDKVAEEKRKEMMGEQERELYALRRAENETRNLRRRDIGIGGSIGKEGGAGDGEVGGARGVPFPVGEGVEDALKGLETEGNVVRLNMDISTETLTLIDTASDKSASDIPSLIPTDRPQYTFFRYPGSSALLFIYTCPPNSSIKDRMFHASSRASVLIAAQNQGLHVSHKVRNCH